MCVSRLGPAEAAGGFEPASKHLAMRFFRSAPVLVVFFALAGVAHFARPAAYRAIVPPQLGDPSTLVRLSGAAEIAGAIGLLVPQTRRAAGIGLLALLLAVWPANWYIALEANRFSAIAPAWALWLRVPLQLPLIWWVAFASQRSR
jgi:uncharacterized membrane protein